MKKDKLIPKRRFKEFKNDKAWEQRKLGDICIIKTGYAFNSNDFDDNGEFLVITNGNIQEDSPYVNGTIGNKIDIKDNAISNEYVLNKNDILVTMDGTVGRTAKVREQRQILAQRVGRLVAKLEPEFLYQLLNTGDFFDKMTLISHGGTIKHISLTEISEYISYIPSSEEEQKKLGTFFKDLDNLITLYQRKLKKLKELKLAYLSEMFPKEGEKYPKRRFAGFTDPWEQRKFGELADYKKGPFGSAITKDMFIEKGDDSVKVYEQQNAINKDWRIERYFLPKQYVANTLKSFEVSGGDIIVSCAGTIGEIYEIPLNADVGVINQALMRVRVKEKIVDKKIFEILFSNMINDFTKSHSNGSAIKNIPPFADLKPMVVRVPLPAEQEKLICFFSNLDNLITLHQRKLEKLENLKKAYLNEMFV